VRRQLCRGRTTTIRGRAKMREAVALLYLLLALAGSLVARIPHVF
jgi:hypothetical protein